MECQKEIRYFVLPGLLPEQHILAFNPQLGSLCLLALSCEDTPQPRLLAEQLFTESEVCLLLPLLEAYPLICPHEVLYAHFTSKIVKAAIIERCRQQLYQARRRGSWDFEIRPIRNVLSRLRKKLQAFEVNVRAVLETGYMLRPQVRRVTTDSHEDASSR